MRNETIVACGRAIAGVVYLILFPVLAAAVLALGLAGSESAGRLTPAGWLLAAPAIYLTWLVLFLAACAAEVSCWCRLIYQKPRRASNRDGRVASLQIFVSRCVWLRMNLIWSLPLTRSLLLVPAFRHLVLRAYAPVTHLGRNSVIWGYLYDPELTSIGEGAIVGAGAILSAHSLRSQPDGGQVMVTAPIVVGPRAVLGGESRIGLGVRIGADAIVEPRSSVVPYTTIGEGEVWGGSPARLLRHRFIPLNAGVPELLTEDNVVFGHLSPGLEAAAEAVAIHRAVAFALDLPFNAVTVHLSSGNCAAWDSLGQMGIAAALQAEFGVSIPPEECFRLNSIQAIREVLAGLRSQASVASASSEGADREYVSEFVDDAADDRGFPAHVRWDGPKPGQVRRAA